MPLITEYHARDNNTSSANLNYFILNALYYERTSSQNFTFYTSSTTQISGHAGKYRYGDSVTSFNICNNTNNDNYVSLYVGTAPASTLNQGGYVVYQVRVAAYANFTPINTDNRIFLQGGTSIYISTTGNFTMDYTMCVQKFRS